MKKMLLILGVLALGPLRPAQADTVPVTVVTTTPAPLTIASSGGQVLLSLLSHVSGVAEFTTHGQVKMQFIDGLIEFGHYHDEYIAAFDGGVSNNSVPDASGKVSATWGFHVHAISFLNSYFNINPALAQTLDLMEVTPRVSYDMDVHHLVYGYTFGARIPFQ